MYYDNLEKDECIVLVEKLYKQIGNLNKKISELQIFDDVTKVLNRKSLYNTLDYETKRATRNQEFLSVLLLGVNNFNLIKERFGDEIGDIVLVQIARLIKSSTRNIDIIGRYSDDEFMIILPDMNPNNGGVVAERIQRLIDKEIFPIDSRITLSSGLKIFEGESPSKLIEIVERNLHLSKKEYNR